ncbi:HD domain-containing phosphohydrolase [Luteithermobacter gelatinilyticus]|uniref:HD domain-containing phosphohydrolase n=1 Tax=Luteithermobacter gelatinilyticus TaxID=2582913 RepID=UPI001106B84E|nr:HD domain-containing phosphohydrolase [Luteithermobacter gelatinilyticus]
MADFSPWKIRSAGAVIAVLVLAAAVAAMIFALKLADAEKTRDEITWQQQMSVIVAGREAAIEDWLEEQTTALSRLADNAALRIYLAHVIEDNAPTGEKNEEALAQMVYLENQLLAHAQRYGYAPSRPEGIADIGASLDTVPTAGLALTTPEGQLLVSTPAMPPVTRPIAAYLEAGAGSDPIIYGPYPGATGAPQIAFVTPVFGVQEDETGLALGVLVGIKILDQSFYKKLHQPGDMARTAKSYLIRRNNGIIEYLSPIERSNGDRHAPLTLLMDENTPSLIAAEVSKNPGSFVQGLDYDGRKVMATGRHIQGTDWTLVRSVEAKEILGQVEERRRNIIWISGLIIVTVAVLLLLIWRHGVSVRVSEAAKRQRALTAKFEKLSHFMEVVTDSQPTSITAVDENGQYTFANRQAEKELGLMRNDIVGQPVKKILDPALARETLSHVQEVLDEGQPVSRLETQEENRTTVKADYLPLMVGPEKGVLIVREDISLLVRERERREQALKNLVQTLTMIIDRRDPYSARHSTRVSQVARTLAREMECDEITVETAEIAGALMNLGKILVPREVLTRPGELSSEELITVRESIQKSADMLEGLEFEGPVVETLRQIRAHWDGSGSPAGLSGEDILLPARIIAVANAFVAMVSARAHRPGLDMEEAAMILMNDADRIYDRRPVAALLNYLENKGGLEAWKSFGQPPESPASAPHAQEKRQKAEEQGIENTSPAPKGPGKDPETG